ncbi:peroxiredoxin [Croceicoccus naphthovorans]|uniref:thioredoxin-dependent peroxiredoxin n=1 Tax=Croceicoccus naphthovorans TaxID=1348774 RepID=A0A0G3XH38_9SPHN|nr:peroxiredoxin [Croceicoccus naphthovorans]AKM09934.1 peroxiredoxin [Croceicoccus naphthovorans]MBB3990914.1 peroxiredoxin [Croceicoccus naphthovorans]
MKRIAIFAAAALAVLALPGTAAASLKKGAEAPMFSTTGALAGKSFRFTLSDALRKGPVVLYFYPKAFTQGCTLEAHAFAEAMDDFRAAGAQVVGMSNDDLETLKRFSTEACRDEFAVARAAPGLIKAYDVALRRDGADTGLTDRTSYVIAQDGRIVMVHSDMDWREHVSRTLAAVRALKK